MSLDQKSGKHLKLKVEVFFHSNSIKRFLCVAYRNNKIFVQTWDRGATAVRQT